MKSAQRVVVGLPMADLWDDRGPVPADQAHDLDTAAIRELLHHGRLRFVVADCGKQLDWVAENDCFAFWKTEVLPHLAPSTGASLDDFPGGYFFIASEWVPLSGSPIILLEKHH